MGRIRLADEPPEQSACPSYLHPRDFRRAWVRLVEVPRSTAAQQRAQVCALYTTAIYPDWFRSVTLPAWLYVLKFFGRLAMHHLQQRCSSDGAPSFSLHLHHHLRHVRFWTCGPSQLCSLKQIIPDDGSDHFSYFISSCAPL